MLLYNTTLECIQASGHALSIQNLHYYIGHYTAVSQRGAAKTLWCDRRTTATMLLYAEVPTVDDKALRSRHHERLPLRQTISMIWCSRACRMWATLRTVRGCAEPRVQAVSLVIDCIKSWKTSAVSTTDWWLKLNFASCVVHQTRSLVVLIIYLVFHL